MRGRAWWKRGGLASVFTGAALAAALVAVSVSPAIPAVETVSARGDEERFPNGVSVFSMMLRAAGNAGPVMLGLSYQVPSGDGREDDGSKTNLAIMRDLGLLKGYSVPPNRLVFDPGGRAVLLPQPPVADGPASPEVVRGGNAARPRIALTFDDGYAGFSEVLDKLIELRAPATFFMCGVTYGGMAEDLKRGLENGYEFANHSLNHPWFTQISDEQAVSELTGARDAFRDVTGTEMAAYFRPPGAFTDARVEQLVAGAGYVTVMWTRDARDWSPLTTPDQLIARACANPKNGDILLMHTHGRYTLECLPVIVRALREKGFELTTVSGVLER